MRNTLYILMLAAIIAGCTTPTTNSTYNPNNIEQSNLAKIKINQLSNLSIFTENYSRSFKDISVGQTDGSTTLLSVSNHKGEKIISGSPNLLSKKHQEIYLDSGVYSFKAHCIIGGGTAKPVTKAKILKGKNYILECFLSGEKSGFFGQDIPTTAGLRLREI